MKKNLSLVLLAIFLPGCAALHHVQIGEIDNRKAMHRKPIEIKVSEMGVDLNDVKAISNATMGKQGSQQMNDALAIIQMFQMGPKTGAPVYSTDYVKNLGEELRATCPNGSLTGLMVVREMRKYPVISGEIVKIKGDCIVAAKD
jgi:hypothetical protein